MSGHRGDPRPMPSRACPASDDASRAGRAAVVPQASVIDFETGVLALRPPDLDAIQDALERAGVEFIDGDQPGVRFSLKRK